MIHNFNPEDALEAGKNFLKTPFEGMYYFPLKAWKDKRGFFAETGKIPEIEEMTGQEFKIAQLNQSFSEKNVIRGFHAEAWNKLINIPFGVAFCAWADIRPDSKTFGEVMTMKLGMGEGADFGSIYLPQGIANSFLVLEGPVVYSYAVDKLYQDRDTSRDVAINLFDPDLGVNWPIPKEKMIISQRDLDIVSLREKFPEKF